MHLQEHRIGLVCADVFYVSEKIFKFCDIFWKKYSSFMTRWKKYSSLMHIPEKVFKFRGNISGESIQVSYIGRSARIQEIEAFGGK